MSDFHAILNHSESLSYFFFNLYFLSFLFMYLWADFAANFGILFIYLFNQNIRDVLIILFNLQ